MGNLLYLGWMDIFYAIIQIFLGLWWLWLPVFLAVLFIELWVNYLKEKAIKKINWLLLEVKISRDIEKTPKAMEQIFSGFYAILTKIKFFGKYWFGRAQPWLSLEIAGIDGSVYFFIRTPERFRNLVEAQIHAQYPSAEISEVLDYAGPLANKVPSKTHDIKGVELMLGKDDYLPIRTYIAFEESEKERRVDPMASFLEILSKLKAGENIFIQYLRAPTAEKGWREKGQEAINKLTGKKIEVKKTWFGNIYGGVEEFIKNFFVGIAIYPTWENPKKEDAKTTAANLSPGEKNIVEAIENKISKLAFKTNIRYIYIARSDSFNSANLTAVTGSFRQFNSVNLNAFKGNDDEETSIDREIQPFRKRFEFIRKKKFIKRYINRRFVEKTFILNTEELATIYHYPIFAVEAPTLRRVEAKKAEPPVSLPI